MNTKCTFACGLLIVSVSFGCVKKAVPPPPQSPPPISPLLEAPEQVLKDFVTSSFQVHTREDLKKLMSNATGEARALLEKVTPDQLERFYKNPHIEFISVSVVDIRKISETKLEMDYRIQYLDLNDGAGPTEFTNVKNAELLREGTAWRVSLVKGLTTSMAFRDGLLIEIAPKKAAGGSSGGDAQRKVPLQEPSATKP
jgi:hypothetical protein